MDLKRIYHGVGTAYTIYKIGSTYYDRYRGYKAAQEDAKRLYVTVPEDADIFEDLLGWVNNSTDPRRLKVDSDTDEPNPSFLYDGEGAAKVNIGGHVVNVVLMEINQGGTHRSSYSGATIITPSDRGLVFSTCSREAFEAVQRFINEKHQERRRVSSPPGIFRHLGAYWNKTGDLRPRDLDSVILRSGERERLVADLDHFLAAEEKYNRMGMPWHRGYLLHGAPGNGKTSLAQAVAYHYNRDLYALSLSGVSSDSSLTDAFASMAKKSIVLLEDVDVFSKTVTRDGDSSGDKGPTLAGLLNVLDGVHTPHGMVVFMTTNYIENLDPALIRSGRVDYNLELKSPDFDQISRSFQHVYGEPLSVEPREFKSMADLMGIMKRHHDSPEAARLEIKADV